MKCLFLAAGYATRLYPLTKNFPKPLLKIADKTILDWLLNDLKSSNEIDEYFVVTNHRFEPFFSSWAKEHKDVKITVIDDLTSDNETRLGAVKDIELAINKCHINDDLMILAGDNIVDFSFLEYIEFFSQKKHTCVMRYEEKDLLSLKKRSILYFDNNDLVSEMIEKPQDPKSNWCCPPFYIIAKDDLPLISEAIADGCSTDAPGSLISWLCKHTDVYAFQMPGKRYDIGTLESYNAIQEHYKL